MAHTLDKRIEMKELMVNFDNCIRQDGSIDMDTYLLGYQTIHRFFHLLGKVFSFVASDVESKLSILEKLRSEDEDDRYVTIQSMIKYEKSCNFKPDKTPGPNGSRTLLRLHRALAFVIEFLASLLTLADEDKTGPAAQEAYKNTLFQFHPWAIRKGAHYAMYALPNAGVLIERTCQQSFDEVRVLLPRVIEVSTKVYDITQKLYEDNGCADLP